MIRPLSLHELARVVEIDVSEEDQSLLSQRGARVEVSPHAWRRPARTEAEWRPFIADWTKWVASGDAAIGAIAGDRLVGVAVLRRELAPGLAQLAALFVDRAHRRRGVASALAAECEQLARSAGAGALYVSASETPSAVGFYRSRGFRPTASPHPGLLAREPLDIHMLKSLA